MESKILVKSIEGMDELEVRELLFVGDAAYEVLHPNARGGQYIIFVDKNGKETKPIYVRRYGV
jgi:hypothetical protein